MSTPNDDLTEIWNNILKHKVEKDDPLWKEYGDKAAAFDVRLVDEWNKIVDVLLVYVALFISVLISFITQTFTKFRRNPADITNDLLVAIYNQLAAQSNQTSIPPVDPRSYFNQSSADHHAAVIQNALLYTSLSISTFVSVIALTAKLWLVSYSRQAFSVGSPYDRAMKRQEAYNGVLVWNLGGVINMLPVFLLVALYFFGFYVYLSIYALQVDIGHAVGTLLTVGAMFLGFTSLGGAFVPGCPFRSTFSDAIRVPVRFLQTLSKWILSEWISTEKFRWVWIGGLSLLWTASSGAIAYATWVAGTWSSLFFFIAGIPVAYSMQCEETHKPQKHRIPFFSACVFLIVSPSLALASYYYAYPIFISLYATGVLVIVFAALMCSKLSKSLAHTREIDALAWLMTTAPSQSAATFFKKAGQMTGLDESVGRHYRPRLLESLMPLLTLLITSYHVPEHETSDTHQPSSRATSRRKITIELKMEQSDDALNPQYPTLSFTEDDPVLIDEDPHLQNLEIYMSCLAQLSEFEDSKGSFWCLWEDTKQHPKLERLLIDKLVMLAKTRHRLGAIKILNRYGLNEEGNPSTSPAPVSWSAATFFKLRRLVTLMLNRIGLDSQEALPDSELPGDSATRLEPVHSAEEIEEVPEERDNGDYRIC